MLPILIVTSWLLKGSMSQIAIQGNSTAAYGGDAQYRCAIAKTTGVAQVVWKRRFKDGSFETLASYSKRYGQHVNLGRVDLVEASLGSSVITLKNVTWEDDSCYICAFNVFPDGSKDNQTCLTVEGLSEVKTGAHALVSGRGEETVVFSCSATGKPTPTIQWVHLPVSSPPPSQSPASTVANSDGTFASSCNITLRLREDWSGHVDCLLNAGMTGQRRERIPFSLGAREGTRFFSATVVVVIFAAGMMCVVAYAVLRQKRLKDNESHINMV